MLTYCALAEAIQRKSVRRACAGARAKKVVIFLFYTCSFHVILVLLHRHQEKAGIAHASGTSGTQRAQAESANTDRICQDPCLSLTFLPRHAPPLRCSVSFLPSRPHPSIGFRITPRHLRRHSRGIPQHKQLIDHSRVDS